MYQINGTASRTWVNDAPLLTAHGSLTKFQFVDQATPVQLSRRPTNTLGLIYDYCYRASGFLLGNFLNNLFTIFCSPAEISVNICVCNIALAADQERVPESQLRQRKAGTRIRCK